MTTAAPVLVLPARWPLTRVLTLILAAAFLGLTTDIRVEHVEVVRETFLAWTPIVYSAFMALACLVAILFWNPTSRRILQILFLLAFLVGGLGFYLHNKGHLTTVLTASANAWIDPKMKHSRGPPQAAPMAFAGLGLLGLLATLKRFNSRPLL